MEKSSSDLFPGQYDDEHLEICIPRHWITIIPFFSFVFLTTLFIVLIDILWIIEYADIPRDILLFINFAYFTFIVHIIFIRIFNYILYIIIVTNYRIIDVNYTTVFHRERKMIDISNIQDINMKQRGLLQRILNYGEITLHNSAGETIFIFQYLPKILKMYNMLNHIYKKITKA